MLITLPSLTALNSTSKPINTLNYPAAVAGSHSACGTGAGFPFVWLIRPVWWIALRVPDVLLLVVQAVLVNVRTHSLRHLEAHIHANTFQSSDPLSRPLYIRNAFETVYQSYCWVRGTVAFEIAPMLDNPHKLQRPQASPHLSIGAMPPLPRDANGDMNRVSMTVGRAYWLSTPCQLGLFREELGSFVVVYATVGINSMGKFSVLKALLGLDLDITGTSLPIGTGTNTTTCPVVPYIGHIQIRRRLTRSYLMDHPG